MTVRVHCVCVGCLGAWVCIVVTVYMGVNVMVADGVRQWMWAVGEIGTGLGNVLGNRVVCLFSGILLGTHPLRLCISILLGHSVR